MKFALFVEPRVGGTYSLFRYLKPGLAAQGIDVEWMSVADGAISAPASHMDLQMGGFVKASAAPTEKAKARALLNALVAGQYEGVFVNVLADRMQMNIARYPANNFMRIMAVPLAGSGPDLLNLKRRFGGDPRTQFFGTVASANLPLVLSNHDVLIMPSRFEGFGLALVEAMAGGCVPVASRIAGVTDAIVEHDNTGFLFPVGNWREAARYIRLLADRPDLLAAMSERARQRASKMFDAGRMAASYAKLITTLTANPPHIAPPLLIESWRYPSGMRSGLRTFLPTPIKNLLREARERLRGSAKAM